MLSFIIGREKFKCYGPFVLVNVRESHRNEAEFYVRPQCENSKEFIAFLRVTFKNAVKLNKFYGLITQLLGGLVV